MPILLGFTQPVATVHLPAAGAQPATPYPSGLNIETLGTDCTPNVQAPPPPPSPSAELPTQAQQQQQPAANDQPDVRSDAEIAAQLQLEEDEQHRLLQQQLHDQQQLQPDDQQLAEPRATTPPPSPRRATTPIATQPLLGTVQPYWIPDGDTGHCMLCASRFSMLRRRHHCRACGLVLCASCCGLRARLAYMGDQGEFDRAVSFKIRPGR